MNGGKVLEEENVRVPAICQAVYLVYIDNMSNGISGLY
jgi:hypothetical protein